MDYFNLNLIAQKHDKKIIERMQADGINTVKDLLDKKDDLTSELLNKIKIEVEATSYDRVVEKAGKIQKKYSEAYENVFLNLKTYAPPPREAIPLVLNPQTTLLNKELTDSLNKIIAIGEVIEIYGNVGTGKTYLCHHLSANTLIAEHLRSYSPEVLYVDCEGGFDTSIYKNTIENLVKNNAKPGKIEKVTPEFVRNKIFEKIHYKRVLDFLDLIEFMKKMKILMKERGRIKLIIIDSFPTHFRSHSDQKNVARILNQYSMKLAKWAKKYQVCIILTNVLVYLQQKKNLYGDSLSNVHSKIYLDKLKSNHFMYIEKSNVTFDDYIQKPISYKFGENGLEFSSDKF